MVGRYGGIGVFWQWSGDAGEIVRQSWARALVLEFPEGRGLAPHAAPADALFICMAGTVRFSLEADTRDLHPGDGVAMRAGQMHAVTAGPAGRAILLLRQTDGER